MRPSPFNKGSGAAKPSAAAAKAGGAPGPSRMAPLSEAGDSAEVRGSSQLLPLLLACMSPVVLSCALMQCVGDVLALSVLLAACMPREPALQLCIGLLALVPALPEAAPPCVTGKCAPGSAHVREEGGCCACARP